MATEGSTPQACSPLLRITSGVRSYFERADVACRFFLRW